MDNFDSPALDTLPLQLRLEYEDLLREAKDEMAPVPGSGVVLNMLLERYAFVYSALRNMERDWENVEIGRYNQLLGLWVKVATGLLNAYAALYAGGALNELMLSQLMMIVSEEVEDADTLDRIRARLQQMRANGELG